MKQEMETFILHAGTDREVSVEVPKGIMQERPKDMKYSDEKYPYSAGDCPCELLPENTFNEWCKILEDENNGNQS